MKKRLLAIITAALVLSADICTAFAAVNTDEPVQKQVETGAAEEEAADLTDDMVEETFEEAFGKTAEENSDSEEILEEKSKESANKDEAEDSPKEADEPDSDDLLTDVPESDDLENEESDYTEFAKGYVAPENIRIPEPVENGDGDELLETLEKKYVDETLLNSIPLRNQGDYGTCWAFSTIGLAEFSLAKQGKLSSDELSRLHLAYYTQNSAVDPLGGTEGDQSYTPNTTRMLMWGGNYELAGNALATWIGAADENVVPYSRAGAVNNGGRLEDEYCFEDIAHLSSFYWLNIKNDPDSVKRCIKDFGGVGITFCANFNSTTYNSSTKSFYTPNWNRSDHAVMIVGWDDDYPASNFVKKPSRNGAWLVRNSWTTGNYATGQNYTGYFWMSYDDATLDDGAIALEVEPADEYDNNYQYDGGIGASDYSGLNKAANVFTVDPDGSTYQDLEAVSIFTSAPNIGYTVEIYRGLTKGSGPVKGTPAATKTGYTKYEGFNTIELDSPVRLNRGETFSVVVSLDKYSLLYENATVFNSVNYPVSAKPGQSYTWDGGGWCDFGASNNANVRIKAFTKNSTGGSFVLPQSIVFSDDISQNGLTLNKEEKYNIEYTILPDGVSNRKVNWESSNDGVASVDSRGTVTAIGIGKAVIKATSKVDSSVFSSFEVTVTNELKSIKITGIPEEGFIVGKQYQLGLEAVPKGAPIDEKIKWYSYGDTVISIDQNGLATVKDVGEAIIFVDAWTATTEMTVQTTLDRPVVTVNMDTANNVTLTIKPVQGAYKYVISRSVDGSNPKEIHEIIDSQALSYTFAENVSNISGKVITYYVHAVAYQYDGLEAHASVYKAKSYKITYNVGKGKNNLANPDRFLEGDMVILEDAIPPTGYTFAGWYWKNGNWTYYTNYLPVIDYRDYTMNAVYSANEYRIRYYANGGEGKMNDSYVSYDKSFTLPAGSFKKTGYNFECWNTEPDGTGRSFANRASVKNLSSKSGDVINLYAQWAGTKFNIKLDPNGGYIMSGTKKLTSQTVQVVTEGNYHDLSTPERTGYNFDGWYTDISGGKKVKNGDIVINDATTLYAHWSPIKSRVEFDLGGKAIKESAPKSFEVEYGGVYGTLPIVTATDGSEFIGWYQEAECLSLVTAGTKVTATENHKLHAGWFNKKAVEDPFIEVEGIPGYDGTTAIPEGTRITIGTGTAGATVYYTTNGQNPSETSPVYNGALFAYEKNRSSAYDMTIKAIATKEGMTGSSVTSMNVKVNPASLESTDLDLYPADKNLYNSLGKPVGAWIAGLDTNGYDYTGENITPTIRVYYGTNLLEEKTDYTVAYKNNKNAYTYKKGDVGFAENKAPSVTATLKGNYKDKVSGYFVIKRIRLTDTRIVIPDIVLEANNKVQKGTTKITYTNDTGKVFSLKAGSDFIYDYPGTDQKKTGYDPDAFKAAKDTPWEVTVTAKLNGNFDGSTSFNETITAKKLISKATVTKIPDQPYDKGNAIEPTLTVKYRGVKDPLRKGEDYTVSYANNTEVGTATVTITGKGDFTGSLSVAFKITGIPMSKVTFPSDFSQSTKYKNNYDAKARKFVYTGEAFEVAGPLDSADNYGIGLSYKYKVGKDTLIDNLTKGTDYTVSYEKNVNAGTATVYFIGKGGYTGTVKKTFGIAPYANSADSSLLVIGQIDPKVYVYGGVTPEPVVKYNEITLKNGTDYTIRYSNNNAVNDLSDTSDRGRKKWPAVTVTFKGNFKGTLSGNFEIEKKDIENASLNALDKVFVNKKGNSSTTFTITDVNGKTLRAGTDFEKAVDITYHNDCFTADGKYKKAKTPVYTGDIVAAGTILDITAKGKGNYKGTITGSYRVIEKDISKASVVSIRKAYTGRPVYLDEDEIILTMTSGRVKQQLGPGDYYIAGYENNVNKGTAKAILKGCGNYGGTKVVSFTIDSASAAAR